MTPVRRRVRRAAEAVVLLVVLVLTAAGWAAGVRVVPVLTGSMTPTVPTGSLVLTTPLDAAAVRPGDVVAFRPPAEYDRGRPVMHRVAEVLDVDGVAAVRTKGDANPDPDPWTISLAGADLARERLVVPHLGRLLAGGPVTALLVAAGTLMVVEGLRSRLAARRVRCTCSPADAAAPHHAPLPDGDRSRR